MSRAPVGAPGPPTGGRRRSAQSLPRPRRAFGPVAGTILTLAAWAAVAHNSGSGWVQALGVLLASFLVIGLVAPALFVRRARCAASAGPVDATVDTPMVLEVAVSGPLRLRPLEPPGPERVTGRRRTVPLSVVPRRRGVLERCAVEVASAAPFGLLWWSKRVVVELSRPVLVAPRTGTPDPVGLIDDRSAGEDARRVDARVGEPRGVREYRAGDLQHWVHWPATAHAGGLMVREMETPAARPVRVWGVLPDDPAAAEAAAEHVLGTVQSLLNTGRAVVLVTAEPGGPVEGQVEGVTDAGRRLARALPRAPDPRARTGRGAGP
ncbi:MAG: DUF58 domain-containing protein [Acidimicrobiales bacterium]